MNSSIKTLAALLMVGVAFAACSSSDDSIIEQPVNPTEPKTYTMTIKASKGDDNTTRGLYWNNPNTYDEIKVLWHEGEKVRVVQKGVMVGTLTSAASVNGSTTLSGTLTGVIQDGDLQFYLHADENCKMDYTGQNGGVMKQNENDGNIEYNYDFAEAKLTKHEFRLDTQTGTITNSDNSQLNFTSSQAIVRFELFNSDGTQNVYAKELIISDGNTGNIVQSIDGLTGTKTYGSVTHAPSASSQSCIFTMALNLEDASDLRLFALDSDGILYTYEKSGVTFEKGKYYKVKVRMKSRDKYPLKDITPVDKQFIGWYIGASGEDGDKEYYAYNSYSADRKALIAYVGRVPNYFYDFLAIGLHDSKLNGENGRESLKNMREYIFGNSVGNYAAKNAITIGGNTYDNASYTSYSGYDIFTYDQVDNSTETASNTSSTIHIGWRMPTITDWRYIIYGLCGSPSPTDPAGVGDGGRWGTSDPLAILNANAPSGYNLDLSSGPCYYCTSSGVSGENNNVWYIKFSQNNNPVQSQIGTSSDTHCYLRPVFAY